MSRDSSGNYTLPVSGNPVVSGTTISSTWANGTFNDLATEMTDSLSRSGKGGMLSVLKIADGAVSAPGLAFTSEPSSGLYRIGAADFAISVTNTKVMEFTTTAIKMPSGVDVQLNGVSVTNAAIFTSGNVAKARLATGTPNTVSPFNFVRGDGTWAQPAFSDITGTVSNAQVPQAAVTQYQANFKGQNVGGLASTSVTVQADPGGTPSGSAGALFYYY